MVGGGVSGLTAAHRNGGVVGWGKGDKTSRFKGDHGDNLTQNWEYLISLDILYIYEQIRKYLNISEHFIEIQN